MILDWMLAALLVVLVLTILLVKDLLWAVASFITFGLVVALAWSRLQAPDLALAEAAIGASLMTLFLLDSVGFGLYARGTRSVSRRPPRGWKPMVTGLGGAAIAFFLLPAFLTRGPAGAGMGHLVERKLEQSGVEHQVSAVLLNFRFFDTWFEMTVFWFSILAVLAARGSASLGGSLERSGRDAVLVWFIRLLFPLIVLFSVYLLWRGKYAAGGAFQSGVVLGAGLSILALTGRPGFLLRSPSLSRCVVALGVCGFFGVGILTLSLGGALGEMPPMWAGDIILVVETVAAVSIGMSVPYLFAALQVRGDSEGPRERPA